MRTRKGTGRSVAARTFSLVLKTLPEPEPEPEPDARAADDDAVPPATDASSGSLSGVAAGSAGASGSVGARTPPSRAETAWTTRRCVRGSTRSVR